MAKRTKKDYSQLSHGESQADGALERQTATPSTKRGGGRVTEIPMSQILPDRFQPRPLLPPEVKGAFFSGKLDYRQAAGVWLELADHDEAIADQINTLLKMGKTFEEHGQIKPVTGSWEPMGDGHVFILETGERRFWATALVAVLDHPDVDPTLEVREVQAPSRERQIIENQHAESPSAIGRAREIAAALLTRREIHPPQDQFFDPDYDDFDYYRQVFSSGRLPRGTWPEIEALMGLRRQHMQRLLNVLSMPTHLLEEADRRRVPERVLREILELPEKQWERALQRAIQEGWTHADVEPVAEDGQKQKEQGKRRAATVSETKKAAGRMRSFLKIARNQKVSRRVGEVATELVTGVRDPNELDFAAALLEELAAQIRLRIQNYEEEQG
ncbi:MAG: hypothetical protein DWQ07_17720 [Chloroflexi bacterium]|nr:MAG: hypothetical protein DWQ07_17720 [Chloroflexota bacterium]